jgi:hypothetical protein
MLIAPEFSVNRCVRTSHLFRNASN